MHIEGCFGLASIGKGALARDFAKYSANYVMSDMTGMLLSAHNFMPNLPHFSTGGAHLPSAISTTPRNAQAYSIHALLHQQQQFLEAQQKLQVSQQNLSNEQVGLMKDMIASFDRSFKAMMDVMSKVVVGANDIKTSTVLPSTSAYANDSAKEYCQKQPSHAGNIVNISDAR